MKSTASTNVAVLLILAAAVCADRRLDPTVFVGSYTDRECKSGAEYALYTNSCIPLSDESSIKILCDTQTAMVCRGQFCARDCVPHTSYNSEFHDVCVPASASSTRDFVYTTCDFTDILLLPFGRHVAIKEVEWQASRMQVELEDCQSLSSTQSLVTLGYQPGVVVYPAALLNGRPSHGVWFGCDCENANNLTCEHPRACECLLDGCLESTPYEILTTPCANIAASWVGTKSSTTGAYTINSSAVRLFGGAIDFSARVGYVVGVIIAMTVGRIIELAPSIFGGMLVAACVVMVPVCLL